MRWPLCVSPDADLVLKGAVGEGPAQSRDRKAARQVQPLRPSCQTRCYSGRRRAGSDHDRRDLDCAGPAPSPGSVDRDFPESEPEEPPKCCFRVEHVIWAVAWHCANRNV